MLMLISAELCMMSASYLAREHEARAAHVGSELVDLVELPVHGTAADIGIAQIADNEIVGGRSRRTLDT
jgi:hypothetical protein